MNDRLLDDNELGKILEDGGISGFMERTLEAQNIKSLTFIGEQICGLVGNLLINDPKAGRILGDQLRPIFNICKGVTDGNV